MVVEPISWLQSAPDCQGLTYVCMACMVGDISPIDAESTRQRAVRSSGGKVMSLASVSIVGNLTRSPELTHTHTGTATTTLSVAVNRIRKGKDEQADFYQVEVWGKLAELAVKFLSKGNQITACGRLTFDHWTDREGKARFTPVVRAEQIAFPRKSQTGQQGGEETMGRSSVPNSVSGRNLKYSAGDFDEENEAEMEDPELDDGGEEEEDLERIKGAFSGSAPTKSSRERAMTA